MLVLVLMFCACVSLGNACSCGRRYGPSRYCGYSLIIRGKALSEFREKHPTFRGDEYNTMDQYVYTVEVEQAFKVPESLQNSNTIELRTRVQGSLCGTRLALDVDTVYFGFVFDGKARTGLCSPNTAWDRLSEGQRSALATNTTDEFCASYNRYGNLITIMSPETDDNP
ncbi:metalloproteinase inhibitor 3-like [Babylonia areolata]|uniref:metalloproteinase inhibitor 3-like n=1 Tax=Babylonia areolata TaxID=304850 RepID=UPI003FCF7298